MTGKRLFEGRTEQEKFATMVRRFSEASRFRESLAATERKPLHLSATSSINAPDFQHACTKK